MSQPGRILRRLIPRAAQTQEPAVRTAYGTLAGGAGVACNLLLFAGKLAAGLLTGSVSITADAVNNLSDAG